MGTQPTTAQAECMCGWPQNLLLPKGDAIGYPFYLYIMVSDYNYDKVRFSLLQVNLNRLRS